MKYSIVYSSQTGNTKMLADTIRENLPQSECIYFGPADDKALSADKIYLGFWTDCGTCDKVTTDFVKKLDKQDIFLYGTAGAAGDNGYFDVIINNTKKLIPESCNIVGTYMCQGKMPVSIKERYLKMKESGNCNADIDKSIENFEKALSHPDKADLDNLAKSLIKA